MVIQHVPLHTMNHQGLKPKLNRQTVYLNGFAVCVCVCLAQDSLLELIEGNMYMYFGEIHT